MEPSKDNRRAPAAAAAGQGAYVVTREPVVELMTREAFYSAVKLVQPYLTLYEVCHGMPSHVVPSHPIPC